MRTALLPLLPIALPVLLSAQADSLRAVIEGRIRDGDGRPVPEAEVLWRKGPLSTLSRADGSFSLVLPVRGEVVVLVRKPGFNAQALRVNLTEKSSWRGEILLLGGSYRLPDVDVEARLAKPAEYAATTKYDDFFRRKRTGLGRFVSRDDIERMNAFHTLEILRGVPGMSVTVGNPGDPASANIRIPKCTGHVGGVSVFIDGMRLNPTREVVPTGRQMSFVVAEQLQRIGPSNIEMIEVYLGASQMPAELHWDGCAAIAIWTRWNRE